MGIRYLPAPSPINSRNPLDWLRWSVQEYKKIRTAFDLIPQKGEWEPEFTFATPGDLSNSYSRRFGMYRLIDDLLLVSIRVDVTPTFSTASGEMRITLPFPPRASDGADAVWHLQGTLIGGGVTLRSGTINICGQPLPGNDYFETRMDINTPASSVIDVGEFTSGSIARMAFNGWYAIEREL